MIEHPKTTSVSQPDSKKIQGLIGVHILFVAKNSFLTYVYIQFETEFFTTKQPLIPRLARKNKMAGLNSYLASGCRFILCVFLYTVKNRNQKLDVGKQSLRPLPFLSGEENVLHAFLFLAFLFLRFRKVEEV